MLMNSTVITLIAFEINANELGETPNRAGVAVQYYEFAKWFTLSPGEMDGPFVAYLVFASTSRTARRLKVKQYQ
jgi:hypothetical protein